jgi:hypothetical protein
VARGVALDVELNAERLAARGKRAQPDAVDGRGFGRGDKSVAREVERLRRALIPCAGECIGGDGALPGAVDSGNGEGERLAIEVEVGAGDAHCALVHAVEGSGDRAGGDRL